jgi:hypothetical protein
VGEVGLAAILPPQRTQAFGTMCRNSRWRHAHVPRSPDSVAHIAPLEAIAL